MALSISAQVVEAERSLIGWIATAVLALGFLAMVKIALERASSGPVSETDGRETGSTPAPRVRDEVELSPPALFPPPSAVNGARGGPASVSPVRDTVTASGTAVAGAPDQSVPFDPDEIIDVLHGLAAAAAARDALAERDAR